MGSFPVIVPPSPGLLCALGDLVADFRNEFAQTLIRLTARRDADEELARDPRRARGRARASGWTREGIAAEAPARRRSSPTCATTARATRSRCRWTRDLAALDERFNAPARAALRLPHAEHGVGDRQPARGRRPATAREPELPRGATRPVASGEIRSATPRHATTAPTLQPGQPHRRARRSSPSSTRPPSSSTATSPRSTATSTS